jgi:FlaA1/EpsC-like NDP-sugar epimerase
VIPFFLEQAKLGSIPITDERMTRFWLTIEQAVDFVLSSVNLMHGGEIFVPRIPSFKVTDVAKVVCPGIPTRVVGIRPGEKLHEQMIGFEDAPFTYEYADYFKIIPAINHWSSISDQIGSGKLVAPNFVYASDSNTEWMSRQEVSEWLDANQQWIDGV